MQSDSITAQSIAQLIDLFYAQVRRDGMLGPVFEKALPRSWDEHIARIAEFWSSILLGTQSFQGNVFAKHMALEGIREEHFVRWLSLFKQTVLERYDVDTAGRFLAVADRVAGSLQLGFFNRHTVRASDLPGRA
ncbi:MAG: hypothetical protein NVSMB6_05990 [Burkholderiaceae bacterium]